jgi:tetratricopeptide (TPR) repeat protein
MSLNDLGNEQAGQGMETEARRTQQRCLALRQQIARDHPDVADYQKELGIGYLVWADREEISGAIDRSLESARHGREVFERLARAYPDVADYSYRLTGALQRIARSFHQLGRTEESEAVLRQATELAERVYHDHPEVLDHKDSVVNCYRNLGWVQYRLQNRLEDALATYQKAKAIEARTVLENPDLRVNRTALARLHHEIGRILTRLKRFDEALAEYEPALRTYESDVARDPSSFRPRRNLAYLYFDQGRVHRGAGREREAAAAWRRALPMFEEVANSQAVDPYDRACVQAICAAIVGNAADPLPPADQARRERFAEAAVAALREAVRGGYHSVPMVESDPDFDAIREREDFKALMAELRVGGPSLNAAATEPASPDAPTRAAPDSKAGDG